MSKRGIRMNIPDRPERKLPPPAPYVPPPHLRGRMLTKAELARERKASLARQKGKDEAA